VPCGVYDAPVLLCRPGAREREKGVGVGGGGGDTPLMLRRPGASPPAGWCSSARSPSCGAGTRGSPAHHRPPPPTTASELRVRFMLPLPFAAAPRSAALTGFCGYTSGTIAQEALQAYAAARPCCGNISFFPHSSLPGCRHMPHLLTCSSTPLQLQHSSGRCHRGNGGHILWAPFSPRGQACKPTECLQS
jgi:hypothetical protein